MRPSDTQAAWSEADQALSELLEAHRARWVAARLSEASSSARWAAAEALFADLEQFVRDHPGSRWELSIHETLGAAYQRRAASSRALPHLIAAWSLSRDPAVPLGWRFADRAQVALGLAFLELGRAEAFAELLRQAGGRSPSSPALGAVWRAVLEGWNELREDPSRASLMCGAVALDWLARALGRTHPTTADVLGAATVQDARGLTLARLQEIGRRHGLALQAAVRSPGASWLLPAVVHWKEDLWRTVLAPHGAGFWVYDPTRGRIWMRAEDLEAESSGYCLVPLALLPAGWRAVGPAEAAGVVGRSYAQLRPDAYDDQCPTPPAPPPVCPPPPSPGCGPGKGGFGGGGGGAAGGGAPPGGAPGGSPGAGPEGDADPGHTGGQGNCKCVVAPCPPCLSGLPQWRISEPFMNVWLEDEPWGYEPPQGPLVRLGLSYKLRDASNSGYSLINPWEVMACDWDNGTIPAGSSLGVGWNSRWFTYVRVLERGDEFTPDHLMLRTPERGYFETYLDLDQTSANPVPSTRAVLRRVYEGGQQTGWELVYPDGSVYRYGLRVEAGTMYWPEDFYFLTAYLDPAGNALEFEHEVGQSFCEEDPNTPDDDWYHTLVRLTGIRDATGALSTLTYGDPDRPTLVTGITDPYERTATFQYNADGYLTNLTDVAGISAGFAYAEVGLPSPLLLWRMTTPYGDTRFHITEGGGSDSYTRGVTVLLPEGRWVAAIYWRHANPDFPESFDPGEIPQDLPVENALDTYTRNRRNSYFWDLAQTIQLSTTNLADFNTNDFRLARTRHWLLEWGTSAPKGLSCLVSTVLAWEQAPSPDGQTPGAITWYGHDGKDYPWAEGTSALPSLIARVMPDETTWYQWLRRNSLGYTTNLVERWIEWDGQTPVTHFRTNRFEYAANGVDLLAHFGPDGTLETGYAYDPAHPHLPVALTNALGEVTRYYYAGTNEHHRLLGVAHPSGLSTSNYYSGIWLAHTVDYFGAPIADNALRTNSFTWDTNQGRLQTHTDPRGLTRTFSYDPLGRLTRVDFPDNTWFEYAYTNGAGLMLLDRTASRDRLGNWTRFEYNGLRQLTRVIDPLGRETRYTYCGCGGPESVTRAWGTPVAETNWYAYDFAGRLVLVTAPDDTTVTNVYDALGRLVIVGRPYGTTTNYYDNLGRLRAVENAAGLVAELVYDDHDRVLRHTDAHGVTVTNAYDALGRLTRRVTLANDAVESWGYTAGVSSPTAYTNQLNHVTLWTYDPAGRKTNEVQVGVFTNSFTYTPADDLATLSDGKGNVTSWTYDAEGRVTEKKYQGQPNPDLLYLYNANGWLTHRFTRTGTGASTNGYFTTYGYDAVGNLTNVTYPAGTASITNWYDALNRLTNRLDGLGQTQYRYAVLGNGLRTFTEDGPWANDEVTVTNLYGRRAGLRIAQPTGAFVVTNAWDTAGRWWVVGGTAGTFTYAYPAESAGTLPIRLTLPGGGYLTNTYDALARLTRTELRAPDGALRNAHGYQYDLANQRTLLGRTNSAYPAWNGYWLAGYDPAGQLTNAWAYQPDGTPVTSQRWSYGYDAAQNLVRRTNNVTVETFTVNALNQVVGLPDGSAGYDRRGNLVSRTFGGSQAYWSYTYDHENQLTRVQTDEYYTPEASRWKVEFVYDGAGRVRIKRDYTWLSGSGWYPAGETRYLYDGLLIVQERSAGNLPLVTYTRGRDLSGSLAGAGGIGGLLARSHGYSSGNWSYHNFYHADGNGNVTALVNSAGTLQASYRYDPYGRYLNGGGPLASTNVLRFSSKPWVAFAGSTTSGLYSYGYRFYDPYLQRWVNRDPIGEIGGFNLYGYTGNNPIGRIDPHGLDYYGGGKADYREMLDCFCKCGKSNCEKGASLAKRALSETQKRFPKSIGHNDRADAWRHCYWSCEMARDLGVKAAECIGNVHENANVRRGQSPEERQMDDHNNSVGRDLAAQNGNCGDLCQKALDDGKLKVLR